MTDQKSKTSKDGGAAVIRHRRKRLKITLGVILVLVVALVVAGLLLYNQLDRSPDGCATCHDPMGSYVTQYAAGVTQMEAYHNHATYDGHSLTCTDCHDNGLGDKIKEGTAWITGNYSDPLPTADLANKQFCLRDGCHTQAQWDAQANHTMSNGNDDCGSCHTMHDIYYGSTGDDSTK
jgi:hypothetical protein